jgi:hypothetical protein
MELHYDRAACKIAALAYAANSIPDYSPHHRGLHVRVRPFQSVNAGLAALARKEIDVFIGSVTKAVERENDKVLFTDGYYPFASALYVHSIRERERFSQWTKVPRLLGVIQDSTNHWLASALASDSEFETKLSVVTFPSYSTLKEAFERQQVDGVLVDSVLGEDMPDAVEVDGLDKTEAWKEYHERIGYKEEEFAIAVASDPHHEKEGAWYQLFNRMRKLFGAEQPEDNDSLYDPLQDALRSPSIHKLLPELRKRNDLSDAGFPNAVAQ